VTHSRTDRSRSLRQTAVRIEPWGEADLPLLEKLMGDPEMTAHLGGPESPEKIAARHLGYARLAAAGPDRMFAIVDGASGEAVGSVGFWEREWCAELIWEIGWSVIPAFQGRGIATAGAAQAVAAARAEGRHESLHAFPAVENPASNAVCRKLGFTLLGVCRFEYPPGSFMRSNHWRLDL
jgi:RimJ/RimL family protein N-acetyltransferase